MINLKILSPALRTTKMLKNRRTRDRKKGRKGNKKWMGNPKIDFIDIFVNRFFNSVFH